MKFLRYKAIALAITLLIVLTIDASIITLPGANASSTMATYCFVGAVPNPAGIGEQVLIHFGITQGLTSVTDHYTGMSVTITDPAGKIQTLGPLSTDSTGGSFTYFTPTTTGTYYLQAHFPQQNLTTAVSYQGLAVGTVMLASDSSTLAVNVTDQPKAEYTGNPLPTAYWTNPDAQLQEWYSITGNWVETPLHFNALYNGMAPQTAHILWSKQLATGGLAGGLLGGDPVSMETGDAYEGFFAGNSAGQTGVVIMNGKLYYNDYSFRATGTTIPQNVVCVDLKLQLTDILTMSARHHII
jgi:hypothetical protein